MALAALLSVGINLLSWDVQQQIKFSREGIEGYLR